jgi:hypothetical protein
MSIGYSICFKEKCFEIQYLGSVTRVDASKRT